MSLWLPTSRLLVYELLLVDGGGVGRGWALLAMSVHRVKLFGGYRVLAIGVARARVNEEGFEECLGYLHRLPLLLPS